MKGPAPEPSMRGSGSRWPLCGAVVAMVLAGCSELRPLPLPQPSEQGSGDASSTTSTGGAGAAGGGGGETSGASTAGVGGAGGDTGTGAGTGTGGTAIGSYNGEASLPDAIQSIAPTFYRDVLPILQTRCQNCHSPGKIAPFSLVTFSDAQAMATEMAASTLALKMPPWSARSTDECHPRFGWEGDPRLTAAEIAAFQVWSTSGARPGNPADAPPPIVPADDGLPRGGSHAQPQGALPRRRRRRRVPLLRPRSVARRRPVHQS